jgi:hypothetical protein
LRTYRRAIRSGWAPVFWCTPLMPKILETQPRNAGLVRFWLAAAMNLGVYYLGKCDATG